MDVVISPSARTIAGIVADAIALELGHNPAAVLGLATGGTPLPAYQELIARCRDGHVSFARARAFLLDEYIGLSAAHPQSCRRVVEREFTDHIDLPPASLEGPDGNQIPPADAADRYEARLSDVGGIDIQLLGFGRNGHIGFNEPPSSLRSRTRVTTLSDATREDNARFFGGDIDAVPTHAITQGIGTILDAAHLILIATGPAKAPAVAAMIEGPVTEDLPASALQLHPNVTVLLDEAAAGDLRGRGTDRASRRS